MDIPRKQHAKPESPSDVPQAPKTGSLQNIETSEGRRTSPSVSEPTTNQALHTREVNHSNLKRRDQETLEVLLNGYKKLNQSEIQTFVNSLGGRVEHIQNTSSFNIFWGDSRKKAGSFSIALNDSTLTNNSDMLRALRAGIVSGYLPKELLEK